MQTCEMAIMINVSGLAAISCVQGEDGSAEATPCENDEETQCSG